VVAANAAVAEKAAVRAVPAGSAPSPAAPGGGTRYQLLAQALLQQIEAGVYPQDALLPTEAALCDQFQVSRITVLAAMRELQALGVISRRAGVGTRVAALRPRARYLHVGDSIDDLLLFTRGLSFAVLDVQPVVADAVLAARLGVAAGQAFVCLSGLRRVRGAPPVVLSLHYLPALHAAALGTPAQLAARFDGLKGSLADSVAQARGEVIHELEQALDATRLGAREARALEARPGSACLRSVRRYYDRHGALVVVSLSLFPEGRYAFQSRLRRAPE